MDVDVAFGDTCIVKCLSRAFEQPRGYFIIEERSDDREAHAYEPLRV